MNILEAKDELKKGRKVRRKSWPNERYWAMENGQIIGDSKGGPIHPSFKHIEATDWEVVDETELPKTFGFDRAMELAQQGVKVRCVEWADKELWAINKREELYYMGNRYNAFYFLFSDYRAQWEVYEEPKPEPTCNAAPEGFNKFVNLKADGETQTLGEAADELKNSCKAPEPEKSLGQIYFELSEREPVGCGNGTIYWNRQSESVHQHFEDCAERLIEEANRRNSETRRTESAIEKICNSMKWVDVRSFPNWLPEKEGRYEVSFKAFGMLFKSDQHTIELAAEKALQQFYDYINGRK